MGTGVGSLFRPQRLGCGKRLGVALLPCGQELHQHLAMGLHRHAVERLLRTFQSLPLRAESRVTQTRWRIRSIGAGPTPVFKAPAKTSVIPGRTSRARPSHTRTRTTRRTGAIAGAISGTPRTGSGGRSLALLARAVIAPARHHHRPRCGWWHRRR